MAKNNFLSMINDKQISTSDGSKLSQHYGWLYLLSQADFNIFWVRFQFSNCRSFYLLTSKEKAKLGKILD